MVGEVSTERPVVAESLRSFFYAQGGRQGEALLPMLRHTPSQDDGAHPVVPRGNLQPGRQPLRPPALPLQLHMEMAVRGDRRTGENHGTQAREERGASTNAVRRHHDAPWKKDVLSIRAPRNLARRARSDSESVRLAEEAGEAISCYARVNDERANRR